MLRCLPFVLCTSRGHLPLQHRTPNAFRLPNRWASLAEPTEAGESPKETLQREALESWITMCETRTFSWHKQCEMEMLDTLLSPQVSRYVKEWLYEMCRF
jgi:hypothetical protein